MGFIISRLQQIVGVVIVSVMTINEVLFTLSSRKNDPQASIDGLCCLQEGQIAISQMVNLLIKNLMVHSWNLIPKRLQVRQI
jgi:hypothetical protein